MSPSHDLPCLLYQVPRARPGWELSEEKMPESVMHDRTVTLLRAILAAWGEEHGPCLASRNLAVRWVESQPAIGVDPDVAVFKPPPPDIMSLLSIRTWDAGHRPPLVAVEVVSDVDPHKDYMRVPDMYAASGTEELWIFDPLLAGPRSHGGPFCLQVWNREERDERSEFVRTYAGDGPARSKVLDAYLVVVVVDVGEGGQRLRIANDAAGTDLWPTELERLRAERAERIERETVRAETEAALARIRELEAELASRSR